MSLSGTPKTSRSVVSPANWSFGTCTSNRNRGLRAPRFRFFFFFGFAAGGSGSGFGAEPGLRDSQARSVRVDSARADAKVVCVSSGCAAFRRSQALTMMLRAIGLRHRSEHRGCHPEQILGDGELGAERITLTIANRSTDGDHWGDDGLEG